MARHGRSFPIAPFISEAPPAPAAPPVGPPVGTLALMGVGRYREWVEVNPLGSFLYLSDLYLAGSDLSMVFDQRWLRVQPDRRSARWL